MKRKECILNASREADSVRMRPRGFPSEIPDKDIREGWRQGEAAYPFRLRLVEIGSLSRVTVRSIGGRGVSSMSGARR